RSEVSGNSAKSRTRGDARMRNIAFTAVAAAAVVVTGLAASGRADATPLASPAVNLQSTIETTAPLTNVNWGYGYYPPPHPPILIQRHRPPFAYYHRHHYW